MKITAKEANRIATNSGSPELKEITNEIIYLSKNGVFTLFKRKTLSKETINELIAREFKITEYPDGFNIKW